MSCSLETRPEPYGTRRRSTADRESSMKSRVSVVVRRAPFQRRHDDRAHGGGRAAAALPFLVACKTGPPGLVSRAVMRFSGAKGIAVLPLFPIFRQFFHFRKNPSSSVISGTFSRENRFPQKRQKRPKIAKLTKHEPLPKRDAIFATFP